MNFSVSKKYNSSFAGLFHDEDEEPYLPNTYQTIPSFRYPYYDTSGEGYLLYGYGGSSDLYTYSEFDALEVVQTDDNAISTDLDINALQSSYREMIQDGGQGQPKILVDMFGMLLSIVSKQKEFDEVIEQVKMNS